MKNTTIHHTSKKITVSNYPYGRLQCEASFSLEFHPKKGFRRVFQTVNPKTGRLNAEKKSTYENILLMKQDDETGFVSYCGSSHMREDSFKPTLDLVFNNFDKFTPEQIKYCASLFYSFLKVDALGTCKYAGAKFDDIKEYYTKASQTLIQIIKTGENLFNQVEVDFNTIKSHTIPGFNPFTIKTTETLLVGASK